MKTNDLKVTEPIYWYVAGQKLREVLSSGKLPKGTYLFKDGSVSVIPEWRKEKAIIINDYLLLSMDIAPKSLTAEEAEIYYTVKDAAVPTNWQLWQLQWEIDNVNRGLSLSGRGELNNNVLDQCWCLSSIADAKEKGSQEERKALIIEKRSGIAEFDFQIVAEGECLVYSHSAIYVWNGSEYVAGNVKLRATSASCDIVTVTNLNGEYWFKLGSGEIAYIGKDITEVSAYPLGIELQQVFAGDEFVLHARCSQFKIVSLKNGKDKHFFADGKLGDCLPEGSVGGDGDLIYTHDTIWQILNNSYQLVYRTYGDEEVSCYENVPYVFGEDDTWGEQGWGLDLSYHFHFEKDENGIYKRIYDKCAGD